MTMLRRFFVLVVSCWCFVPLGLSAELVGSSPQPIQFDQRVQELASPSEYAARKTPTGARLASPLQDMVGHVDREGLRIGSVSETEGAGEFRITPVRLGRNDREIMQFSSVDRMVLENNQVALKRQELIEVISSDSDGLRQDFILMDRPEGRGPLGLDIAFKGASISQDEDRVVLSLNESGRKLTYWKLLATDARGRSLPAFMAVLDEHLLRLGVDDSQAVYPIVIDPTVTDQDWVDAGLGPLAGADGDVYDILIHGDDMYIGGSFTIVGSELIRNIARWDGSQWNDLDGGTDANVMAMAMDSAGNLYAAGAFDEAGELSNLNLIARWDGESWHRLDFGIYGGTYTYVHELAVDSQDNLYVGGNFESVSGASDASCIAMWDGSDFSALGVGMDGASATVNAVTVDASDNVYAGGLFDSAGNENGTVNGTSNIALWDGAQWLPLGTGTDGAVNGLAMAGTTLYATGSFDQAGAVTDANRVASWNGVSWSALGTGLSGTGYCLAWDGADTLYLGGQIGSAGGQSASYIARWSIGGSSWSSMGSGTDDIVYTLAVGDGAIFAGGFFMQAGDQHALRLAKWSGGSWSPIIADGTWNDEYDIVYALEMDEDGNLYVGGSFSSAGGVEANNLAKWNGSKWSALGEGTNGAVHALLAHGNRVYIGGAFSQAGGEVAGRFAIWNNSEQELGPSEHGSIWGNGVYAFAMDNDDDLYVGGSFTSVGYSTDYEEPANNVAVLQASYLLNPWNALGPEELGDPGGVNGTVRALAVNAEQRLYVAGSFTETDDGAANNIAYWEEGYATFYPLGDGVNGEIRDMVLGDGDDIYVGGEFSTAGGVSANYVAKWDGSAWQALGDGPDSAVYALAWRSGELFAGGQFTSVSGETIRGLTQWDGESWSGMSFDYGYDPITYHRDVYELFVPANEKYLLVGGSFWQAGATYSNLLAKCQFSGTGASSSAFLPAVIWPLLFE